MPNNYHNREEKSTPEEWIKTVFTIKHSEIQKGITQCQVHTWEKLSDNEVICRKCMTALIVEPDYLKELLK